MTKGTTRSALAHPVTGLAGLAFRRYASDLHRYIVRRMRRDADAADLTQEIFERFLRLEKTEAVRNPQAYLFGIASHVVSDARLRDDRSLVTYDSDAVEQATGTLEHSLPDNLAEGLIAAEQLKLALSQLSDSHRAALLLVKRDGLSYEEVSRRMNLTVSTVALYVCEARAKVKLILKRSQGR